MNEREVISVLHVDDDPSFAELTAKLLEREDDRFDVETATTVSEGLDLFACRAFACIVSDYDMPRQNGIEFLEAVRETDPDMPFVLFTGKGSEEVASQAISAGATDYIQKESGVSQYEVLANRIKNAVARYRAEQDVAATENRYRLLIEKTSDVIVIVDPNGTFDYLSPASEDVIGYHPEELIGENGFEYIHPDDRDAAMSQFFAMVENPELQPTIEFRFEQQDGSWVWLEAKGRNLLDEPTIGGLVVYTRDITARKEREERLRRYQTLVESVGDPMYLLDTEGYIEMVNRPMAALAGTAPDSLVGRHVSEFLREGDTERGADLIRELLADPDREWDTYEVVVEPDAAESFPAVVNLGLVLDDEAELLGTAGVVHDLTEHKIHERQLEQQIERLDEFAGIVSHDLRNPLSVARGRVELAQEECDSDHLDDVQRAHERMSALIEDLLSMTRAGETMMEPEQIELRDVVDGCWRTVETKAAQLDVDTDLTLRADETRFQQLVENLLRNAIEHGGDDVTITVGDLPDGFYVEDDGPGISESQREHVFESGYSTNGASTGLGLSIVSDIAEAHGWTPDVTTGADGGARFEFSNVHGE